MLQHWRPSGWEAWSTAKQLVACDELFKAHFIFKLTYDFGNFYTFVLTTIYNINVGITMRPQAWGQNVLTIYMYVTGFCCQALHRNSQSLISHLRIEHGFYPSKFRLVCAQDGGRRKFSTYSGFRKHLNSIHMDIGQVVDALSCALSGCWFSSPFRSATNWCPTW